MAIRFDTSGEGLTRTSGQLNFNADYTIAGWFRMVTDTNDFTTLIAMFGSGADDYDGLETDADGTSLNVISNRTTVHVSAAVATLATSTWVYVALTRSGSTVAGYVITEAGSVSTASVTRATGGTVASNRIGQWSDGSELFNGRVAALKAWSVALTQAELLNEMWSIVPRSLTSLWGFWPCFSVAADRLLDYSGNGRSWTAAGTLSDEDPPAIGWGALIWNMPEAAAAGGTTYADTGTASGIAVGSGTDVAVLSDAGSATSAATGSGADAATFSDSATATSVLTGSGADAPVFADTGAGVSILAGSGADTATLIDTGAGVLIGVGAGADAATFGDAATATSIATGSGADAATFADAATAVSVLSASGAEVAVLVDAGSGVLIAVGSGDDSNAYVDAGGATMGATAGGTDAAVLADTGSATSTLAGSGADAPIYADTGAAVAALFGLGSDVLVMVDAGGGVLVAVGSGDDNAPIPPSELPYQGDAYLYDSAGGTGSIAGGTVQAGPNQDSPIGSVSGGTVQPGPNQDSPTGSVTGGTILAPEVIYD